MLSLIPFNPEVSDQSEEALVIRIALDWSRACWYHLLMEIGWIRSGFYQQFLLP